MEIQIKHGHSGNPRSLIGINMIDPRLDPTKREFYTSLGGAKPIQRPTINRVFNRSCKDCYQPYPITDGIHINCPMKGGE